MISSSTFKGARAYQRVHVETSVNDASPHQLVTLLFDGLLGHIASARGAVLRGDIAAKGHAIGMAVRIVEEGLKAGQNRSPGDPVAGNLRMLYDCVIARLTTANMNNDEAMLGECASLIEPVKQAWSVIGRKSPPAAEAADHLARMAA